MLASAEARERLGADAVAVIKVDDRLEDRRQHVAGGDHLANAGLALGSPADRAAGRQDAGDRAHALLGPRRRPRRADQGDCGDHEGGQHGRDRGRGEATDRSESGRVGGAAEHDDEGDGERRRHGRRREGR